MRPAGESAGRLGSPGNAGSGLRIRSAATYVIRLNHTARGCRPATVRVGRRVAAFNHQPRINAEAGLMLSRMRLVGCLPDLRS
jgi:hypothetical protein